MPYSVIIRKPRPEKMISHQDLESNKTIDEGVISIQTTCSDNIKCRRIGCHIIYDITHVEPELGDKELSVLTSVPSHPSFVIKSSPSIPTVEFLTYILSAFSTWTGISVFALNPIILWNKLSILLQKNNNISILQQKNKRVSEKTRKIYFIEESTVRLERNMSKLIVGLSDLRTENQVMRALFQNLFDKVMVHKK